MSPTLKALRDIGFIDAAKKGQLTFAVFHILGPSIASLDEIAETAAYLGDAKYFIGEEFHQQYALLRMGRGDPQLLFQADQGRGRDHDPQAERDGDRAGRARLGAVRDLHRQQEAWRRAGGTTRSCCGAMYGTGSAISGPNTTASASPTSCGRRRAAGETVGRPRPIMRIAEAASLERPQPRPIVRIAQAGALAAGRVVEQTRPAGQRPGRARPRKRSVPC